MIRKIHMSGHVLPAVGRAGLGNELFPYMRAVDEASSRGTNLLPPLWVQPRIGPTLRGERDTRQYWRLFRRPRLGESAYRSTILLLRAILGEKRVGNLLNVHFETGMNAYFRELKQEPHDYVNFLKNVAKPGVVSTRQCQNFLSVHIRLGDFQQASGTNMALTQNNTSTPIRWYINVLESVRESMPELDIVISSDGTDSQLEDLLRMPGVKRSNAQNALDEMLMMSESRGMVGSRSTFTAWGAFLGEVPLLLSLGGNAYEPHSKVWESEQGSVPAAFISAVKSRHYAVLQPLD